MPIYHLPPVKVSELPLGHMLAMGVGCMAVREGEMCQVMIYHTYGFQQTQQNAT